ncbi:MAG TPA: FUN14 domain-containing protein [Nitrososphaeraceae archaeon]|nr:FUN14 domain-containing protein [Nitrososphaeraceae archaeon]
MIENSIMPFVSTVGFGGIAGFLIGFALKRIMKILAVIAGVFFAALLYLESQHIVNINWDKLQTILNSVLSTIATTATANATSTGGGLSIPSILGNNTGAAAAILPITNTMTNLGIPLTGSTAMGFTIGLLKD